LVLVPQLDEKGHLPSALFGEFLENVFRATRTSAVVKGIRINLIPAEATAMYEDQAGQMHVSWETGKVTADIAILTTGRCPDISPIESHNSASAVYIPIISGRHRYRSCPSMRIFISWAPRQAPTMWSTDCSLLKRAAGSEKMPAESWSSILARMADVSSSIPAAAV
jgi:hypothetical protein